MTKKNQLPKHEIFEIYDDNTVLKFGKYQGFKLRNVPAYYLLFLFDNNKSFGALHDYIKENEEHLRLEKKQNLINK